MTIPVLEVNDLVVKRDGRAILNVDHLTINQGEVLAVIGPNGAGCCWR
jgi:tungstate transport system ATP-binding protein